MKIIRRKTVMSKTLITSALPYANGYLHLGHCAGAYLPADLYARFLRLSGREVLYVCGSDEHGVAITIAADKEGVKPQDIIDKYHFANKAAFEKFGMSFDIYSRTSLEEHHETAKEFFADFLKKDLLVEKEEGQFFDPKAKMFLPDRYVEGICPNCGSENARGDQCDSCGAYYNQLELKKPKSLVSGGTPVVKKTTHWYMRFDKFQEFLEAYIESHSKDWKDNVLQQTRSWLKLGLAERAITRDLDWGVKIADIEGISKDKTEGKALYVWFEAVLGYISGTKHWLKEHYGDDFKDHADEWKDWWQNPETRYIAFIGKDNIVFHTLIFQALLHGRGEGYILPANVPANEFLNLEGQKFSKSRNWSIDLQEFIDDFKEPQYIDGLRYTLAMSFPETKDSDFTWKDFQARTNNELSAIFGNFVNRTLQFAHKNFEGKVPELSGEYKEFKQKWTELIAALADGNSTGEDYFSENDLTMIKAIYNGGKKIAELYERYRFRDALTETMNVTRAANKYFNDEEPWKSNKTDKDKCAKSLYVCLQTVRSLTVLFAPILPHTSQKLSGFLNIDSYTGLPIGRGLEKLNLWDEIALPKLESVHLFEKPDLLFTKIEDSVVEAQVSKLGLKAQELEAEDEEITFDDFTKVKLKVGKIIEAEKVKKSKKLIKTIVDLGSRKKQILAGIAEFYKPEDLIGKKVVVVSNLKPAKLMGVESQGMILAATGADGKLCLVKPEDMDIAEGAEVK